jgi:hypothetical protein
MSVEILLYEIALVAVLRDTEILTLDAGPLPAPHPCTPPSM